MPALRVTNDQAYDRSHSMFGYSCRTPTFTVGYNRMFQNGADTHNSSVAEQLISRAKTSPNRPTSFWASTSQPRLRAEQDEWASHCLTIICSLAVRQSPARCLYRVTVFTICSEPVVLKVEGLKLIQMGNVLHCYLLDFVVLKSGHKAQRGWRV